MVSQWREYKPRYSSVLEPEGSPETHCLSAGLTFSSVIFCPPMRKWACGLQRPAVWTIHCGPNVKVSESPLQLRGKEFPKVQPLTSRVHCQKSVARSAPTAPPPRHVRPPTL